MLSLYLFRFVFLNTGILMRSASFARNMYNIIAFVHNIIIIFSDVLFAFDLVLFLINFEFLLPNIIIFFDCCADSSLHFACSNSIRYGVLD